MFGFLNGRINLTSSFFLSKKLYSTAFSRILLAAAFVFIESLPASAQQKSNFGIEFSFLKKSTNQSLEEVATNVIRLVNNTRTKQQLSVNISVPEGWQLFSNLDKTIELLPADSAFVPIRVIPAKISKGNTNYLINGFLISDNGFQLANDYWYVNVKQFSEWNVSLPIRKVYFINDKEDALFEVMLQNTGNADENITLELEPSRNLLLSDTTGKIVELTNTILLPSGSDTLIQYRVLKMEDTKSTATNAGAKEEPIKKYGVKVSALNDGGDLGKPKLWRGNVEFLELGSEMEIEGHGYSSLPFTVELNAFDVLDNTTLTLDIYGNANFNNERSLAYRYQSNYVDNFFDPKRYIGDYHYLGFFSRRGGIEIGNLSGGKHGAFIGGKGIRGTLRLKHNVLSGMFVRNPSLFRQVDQTGVSVNNLFSSAKINSDTYFQFEMDDVAKINSSILSSGLSYQLAKGHSMKIGAGASYEDHFGNPTSQITLLGFGYLASYSGRIQKLHFSASNRFGSKTYSGARGVLSVNASAGYDFSKKYALAVLYDHYQQNPDVYSGGVLLPDSPESARDRYELKFAIASDRAKFIIRPYYLYLEAITLRTATKAIAFDYRPAAEGDLRFYSSVEGGFVKALDVADLDNFFIAQVFGNLKYKTFSSSLRYYYGPYQAIDQVRFIQTRQNPQRVAFTNYVDTWFANSRMLLKANSNLNYETLFKRISFVLRPELFYYTKNDFTFSFYMEYVLTRSKNTSSAGNTGSADVSEQSNVLNDINIGAGIKKSFGIPLNRKKFHDIEIIVFKDVNGNSVMDNSEKPVENMLINVRTASPPDADSAAGVQIQHDKIINYELLTDDKGTVAFDNLPTGFYSINVRPLTETGGWFDTKEIPELISGKEKIYIPLNKAVRINGSVVLQRDKYSKYDGTIDLSRIRVTSTSSAGNTNSTLTGKNGEFSMFLPVGEYSIEINKGALGDSFEFVNSQVKILLADPNNNYNVTFYVREKKRQMNVKEFKQ